MAALMPQGKQQYFTAGGIPLVGGKVYTYAAGTTTPLATYTTAAASTPNANPVILDSRGEASIFFSAANYKVVVKDSLDSTIWTQDNLPGDAAASVLASLAASTGSSLVGHIASGTGAVATTVQSKLRESVSVLGFGANTTPGITDMTTAIQAAVTYAATVGKKTFLPGGTYLCGDLIIPSNSFIYGEANTVINRNSNYGWQPASGADNITIESIQFDNNAPGTAGTHKYSFSVLNITATNVTVRDCKFYNGYDIAIKNAGPDGIYISNVASGAPSTTRNNFLIENCTFDGFTRNGISITNGAIGVLIRNCIFTNNGLRGLDVEADYGTYTYVKDITVQDCQFIDNGDGSIRGTDLAGGGLEFTSQSPAIFHSENVSIINCYFATTTAVNTLGIKYLSVNSAYNLKVTGCTFDLPLTASTNSVVLEESTYGSQIGHISNNTFRVAVYCYNFAFIQFTNNIFVSGYARIISAALGVRKTISGNLFYQAGSSSTPPITIGSVGTTIINNKFYDDRSSLVPADVIKYSAANTTALVAVDWTIAGNVVESTTLKYSYFFSFTGGSSNYGVSLVRFRDNHISGCDKGIEFASSAATVPNCFDIDITNNSFIGTTTQAVNLNGVGRFTLEGNSVRDCASNTIALNITRSDGYLCANNRVSDTRAGASRATYAISAQNTTAGTPTSLLSANLSRNTQSGFTIAAGEGTSANNTTY